MNKWKKHAVVVAMALCVAVPTVSSAELRQEETRQKEPISFAECLADSLPHALDVRERCIEQAGGDPQEIAECNSVFVSGVLSILDWCWWNSTHTK